VRWLILLCVLFSLGCGGPDRYLASTLTRARDGLDHGDLRQALKYSKRGLGLSTYLGSDPWLWKFRTVEAETFLLQRDPPAALAVLRADLSPDLARSELGVRVFMARGNALSSLKDFTAAETNFQRASALCESPSNRMMRGEALMYRGLHEYRQGHLAVAQSMLHEAIVFARQNHQPFVEALAMSRLGAILALAHSYGLALDWLVPAITLTRQLPIRTALEVNIGNLGLCYYKLGDLDSALQQFQEADREAAALGLPSERSIWLTDIGLIFGDRDDYKTASAYHMRALEFARQGKQPDDISRSLHNLSLSTYYLKDYAASKRYHAEEVQLKGRGGDELYAAYMEGLIQEREGHHDSAEALFHRIIADGGKDPSLQWEAQVALADIHMAENKPDLVERDYEDAVRSLETARRQLGKDEFKLDFRAAFSCATESRRWHCA
jgi:tetratricopeptide (TPR) repeat protein